MQGESERLTRLVQQIIDLSRLQNDMDAIGRISAAYEFSVRPESRFTTYDRPVTFILGRQDPVVGYADALALASSYPRATYLVADAAGHNPHHEQPELCAAALGAWIDAVISSTA